MIVVWSPKSGSGTSVVAASLALGLARAGGARLVDLAGDQAAILGLADEPEPGVGDWLALGSEAPPEGLDGLMVEVAPGLALLPLGDARVRTTAGAAAGRALVDSLSLRPVPTVVDIGTLESPAAGVLLDAARYALVVVRCCYLTLRRAVASDGLARSTGAVVVQEKDRALSITDVSRVLDLPVVATVPADSSIARAVDAGTLSARMPPPLGRAVRRMLRAIDPHGEVAA